jgi:hypothetical protein
MPAESERQRRFMGAELARKRAGKETQTGMSEEQLREFATKGSPSYSSAELKKGYRLISSHPIPAGPRA